MEAVKPAALQGGNAKVKDQSLYLGCSQCSLRSCFTLHEHNEIKTDWAAQASGSRCGCPAQAFPREVGGTGGCGPSPRHHMPVPLEKKAKVMAACVWAWPTGMLWEFLLDRHQPLSPAKTCFQQKTSRCLWNFLTPASKTAVTAKQDFWGSKFWIYTDLSWIPLTPSASVQPSVTGWMGIKIFPFENCHPSKSWSAFGDSEQ